MCARQGLELAGKQNHPHDAECLRQMMGEASFEGGIRAYFSQPIAFRSDVTRSPFMYGSNSFGVVTARSAFFSTFLLALS